MILIVTNREDYTADFLILELRRRHANYARYNTEDYPQRAVMTWSTTPKGVDCHLQLPSSEVRLSEVRSVWYRRPVPPIVSPELVDSAAVEFAQAECDAALQGLWRTLNCFWVSHPARLQEAELKLRQLQVASTLGFSVPDTVVTNSPRAAAAFWHTHGGHVIFKPLRRSRLQRPNGISLIFTNPVDSQMAERLSNVRYAPTLFQEYVEKRLEIRVTVIGKQVFAVSIDSQSQEDARYDWRRGDIQGLRHDPCTLPSQVEAKCVALVEALGLAFGAIDLILTPQGDYVFLEINPNGQWAWIQELRPELPLRESLADLLIAGGEP